MLILSNGSSPFPFPTLGDLRVEDHTAAKPRQGQPSMTLQVWICHNKGNITVSESIKVWFPSA